MATNDDKKQDEDNQPCPPTSDAQIVPPPEVTSIVAGAAAGFAVGVVVGVALGLQVARK